MVTIQPATLAHLPDLRRLFVALTAERRATYPEASVYPVVDAEGEDAFLYLVIDRLRAHDPNFCLLVAVDDDEVVAFGGGEVVVRAIAAPRMVAVGYWFYVQPSHRKRGIMRQLALAGLRWGIERDIEVIEVDALVGDNQWADRAFRMFAVRWQAPVAAFVEWVQGASADTAPPVSPELVPATVELPEQVNGRRSRRRRRAPEAHA